jgi:copper chaperone NosL
MKSRLSISSRILIAFVSGALVAVFFLPAWRIDLFAPQYPEGLTLNIWINGLSGDVDIINGLNHYIGMKHITVDMFPEFGYLKYVVGLFMLLGIVIAVTGSRKVLFYYLLLTVLGGALALYDFYQWGFDYGHNLDPTAPIQVPGLSYQPPVLGHKRLLNFDAYSFPDTGGWIVISASLLAFAVWFVEWYRHRKWDIKLNAAFVTSVISAIVLLTSCSSQPQPFKVGEDICHTCKMGIIDIKFGAEIITGKGKVYKFDDVGCMAKFIKSASLNEKDINRKVVSDFENPSVFIDIDKVTFVVSPSLKSPMMGNAAAFISKSSAEAFNAPPEGQIMDWKKFYTTVE